MAADAIPQAEALRLYLAMIAGREPSTSCVEIRAKRATGGMSQTFVSVRELDRATRVIANRGKLNDTYVGVAPRTTRAGGLEAIEHVWALWVDCDSAESVRQLAAFRPLPSVVIRSGTAGHAHAYWPLREPIPPKSAKRANLRLALQLGADRNACDGARIMRPPGTLNFKADEPRPVVCTRLELGVFDLAGVVGALPDDRAYLPSPRLRDANTAPASSSRIVDGLVRTVREATPGNRNASTYWAACRLLEHQLDTAEAREALRDAAIAAGLPEDEVDRTIASALDRRTAA